MSDDDKIRPIRPPEIVAEVGGLVDESAVCLCIYGDELQPAEVTATLGVEPTRALARGEKPGRRSPPLKRGVWMLEMRGEAPDGPDELFGKLLAILPSSPDLWLALKTTYDVKFCVSLHLSNWNRGFSLGSTVVTELARLGMGIEIDIFAWLDEDET